MNPSLIELNKQFSIQGILKFEVKNDLVSISVTSPLADANIYLQGSHVESFIPKGEKDILWMSKESYFDEQKPIRGGIPICWPWFDNHPTDPKLPNHGFARLMSWSVKETKLLPSNEVQVVLELSSNEQTKSFWPYDFLLRSKIIIGKKLEVSLTAKNTDLKDYKISSALHSYFSISNINHAEVQGLESCEYIDSLDNNKIKKQNGVIRFKEEVDRIYFNTNQTCLITDPDFSRTIKIEKNGSQTSVVWNPWINKSKQMPDFGDNEYQNMLCVETTNAYNDTYTLAPNKSRTLTAIISLEH